ncbi:g-strand binding protein [Mucor circinelloides]
MSERSSSSALRSPSPRSPRRGRSYSPRSTRSSSSRSYSRSRSRSRSYSRRHRSRSRSRSPYGRSSSRSYRHYYSRSPPPPPPHHHHHRRSPPPPPPPRGRYRSRSPPPLRRRPVNKDCRVYVSNLPFEVTWHQLKDFMREAGQVAHVDVLKMANGRSKGCGVVEYRYPEDAKRAIHTMNKAEFMGRPVFVREDREYEHSGPPKDPREAPDDCRLHVSNLPMNASWQDMKDLFRKAGRVLHTDIHTDPGSRRPNGHGTVIFDDARFARNAIEILNGYEWQGHRLEVREGRYEDRPVSTTTSNPRPLPPSSRPPPPTRQLNLEPASSREPLYRAPPPMVNSGHHYGQDPTIANTTSSATTTSNISPPPPPPMSIVPTQHHPQLPPQPPVDSIPPPPPLYHNAYRYGDTTTAAAVAAVVVAPPPPPPPPTMYSSMSLVGGPAANLPTHGHNQIFVNNLPFSTTWQDLIDLFRHVGPVIRSEILTVNGHPKGSGFVRFDDAATCEKAIEKFHGYMYGGRHLDIRLDKYSTTI